MLIFYNCMDDSTCNNRKEVVYWEIEILISHFQEYSWLNDKH